MTAEWKPINPYPRKNYGGIDTLCCKQRFDEGVKAGQTKLLEYLIAHPKKCGDLESMLKES